MCVICCCFLFCLLWGGVCVLFVCLKLQSTQWITGCNQNPYVQTKFAMLDCGGAWKKTWKCVFCRLNESAEHNLNFLFRQKACIQSACLFLIWRIVDTGWNQAFSNMCINCFIEQQNKSAQMWNKNFFFFFLTCFEGQSNRCHHLPESTETSHDDWYAGSAQQQWNPASPGPSVSVLWWFGWVSMVLLHPNLNIIIIIMYIYHALINALSTHMIHINLNVIFHIHVEHSPTKTIYIK